MGQEGQGFHVSERVTECAAAPGPQVGVRGPAAVCSSPGKHHRGWVCRSEVWTRAKNELRIGNGVLLMMNHRMYLVKRKLPKRNCSGLRWSRRTSVRTLAMGQEVELSSLRRGWDPRLRSEPAGMCQDTVGGAGQRHVSGTLSHS